MAEYILWKTINVPSKVYINRSFCLNSNSKEKTNSFLYVYIKSEFWSLVLKERKYYWYKILYMHGMLYISIFFSKITCNITNLYLIYNIRIININVCFNTKSECKNDKNNYNVCQRWINIHLLTVNNLVINGNKTIMYNSFFLICVCLYRQSIDEYVKIILWLLSFFKKTFQHTTFKN